ncbi:MAG: YegS/Rv2252/BmrU family lipid kinase [Lachnospiraceae bacterium]|nr:YegS/Rv2252/BmrU family lipid kinase [Lachnospiraceae bacterium]
MKKLLFIYNLNAGTGLLKPRLADIIDFFVKSGYEVIAYPTQGYQDALKKALEYQEQIDLLVCGGGDGTLDEVVNAMAQRETKVPIGYIPAGTTNDFAKSLNISRNILKAADTAVRGIPFACDVGRFNGEFFVYVAAFGIFTDVSYATDQSVKNMLGHLAYVLEGAKRIFNVPAYNIKVTYDDGVIEDEFVFGMVTNSHSVGGFKGVIGTDVVFDDGLFEVLLIKWPKNPKELNDMIGALLLKQVNEEVMYSFQTSKVRFAFREEVQWTLDGEYGGSHEHVYIENQKQLLEIMIRPSTYEKLQGSNYQVSFEEDAL